MGSRYNNTYYLQVIGDLLTLSILLCQPYVLYSNMAALRIGSAHQLPTVFEAV